MEEKLDRIIPINERWRVWQYGNTYFLQFKRIHFRFLKENRESWHAVSSEGFGGTIAHEYPSLEAAVSEYEKFYKNK